MYSETPLNQTLLGPDKIFHLEGILLKGAINKGVKVDFGPLAMLSTIYRVQLRGVLLFIFFSLYFVSNKDLFP